MKKNTVFSELNQVIGQIIEGHTEIDSTNIELVKTVVMNSEAIPDQVRSQIKNNLVLSQETMKRYLGVDLPSIDILLERPLEYDSNTVKLTFQSSKPHISQIRELCAMYLAFFYADSFRELNESTNLVILMKRYIDYLEKELEKNKKYDRAITDG